MGYLMCDKCGGYYELKEDESPEDFDKCECDGNLKFVEKTNSISPEFRKEPIGIICTECGSENPEKAEICYECGMKIENNILESLNVQELTTKGIHYYKKKDDYKTALKYFFNAINMDRSYPLPYFYVGYIFYKMGVYDKALMFLNEFIALATPDLKRLVKKANKKIISAEIKVGLRVGGGIQRKNKHYSASVVLMDDLIQIKRISTVFGRPEGTEEIKIKDIIDIGFVHGSLGTGILYIKWIGKKIQIKVSNKVGDKFVFNVKKKFPHLQEEQKDETSSSMEEIKKAKELLDMGAISQEEFNKIKNNCLKKLE